MPIRKIDHGSTGIYRRVTTRAEPFEDGTPDAEAMLAVFDEAFKTTIDDVIADVEKAAASVLSQYSADVEVGGTPGKPIFEHRRSDKLPWVLPREFPARVTRHEQELAQDARRVMWEIHDLRRAMNLSDVRQAALAAYRLGRLTERMIVRLFEPDAKRGATTKRAASAGGTMVNRPHRAKWAAYQADVDAEMQANKRMSYSQALSVVAQRYGVHRDTVKEHTTNPRPRPKRNK